MEDTNRRQFLRTGMVAAATVAAGMAPFESEADEKKALAVAWIDDPAHHLAANQQGRNYWNAYVPEVLCELGLQAAKSGPDLLADGSRLGRYSTLLLCDLHLGKAERSNLEQWVRQGGTLIAVGTKGIDELCGIRTAGWIAQPGDEFTCAATFSLAGNALTNGIHSSLAPEQRLLIFSEAQKLETSQATALARLYDNQGADTRTAAITARELGRGKALYFGFNLFQTIWVLHQGRPIDKDYDGDGWFRRSDAIVIRPHSRLIAYADEILYVLQNMIGVQPHPFIHQLPPVAAKGDNCRIPDAVFFYGGDDEGSNDGIQIKASNFMKEKGLPYHINAMPRKDGTFGLTLEDARKIQANGHEIAIHYNFIDNFGPGQTFSREQVLDQAAAFREHFKVEQTCSVNHWTRWTGWAETAKWIRDAGCKADNSFCGIGTPPMNPVDTIGFSFGTAFPFWFYDGWRGKNARIDLLEEPTSAYECGYKGKETDFPLLHQAIDLAAQYHMTLNFFFHPIYIANYPTCREAIAEALRYISERNIAALHMGPDALYHWWKARSDAKTSNVMVENNRMRVDVECDFPDGVVVKIPLGKRTLSAATANGAVVASSDFKTEQRFGQNWGLIAVPSGKTSLEARFA